jgi:hypothetical protein
VLAYPAPLVRPVDVPPSSLGAPGSAA